MHSNETAVYIKKSALYWQHVNHNVARTMVSFLAWLWSDDKNAC